MIDAIWIKAILKALVLPPTGPLLIAVAGLTLLARKPRMGRWLATFGVVLLLVLSLPVVSTLLLRFVDASPPLDLNLAKSARAIVVLGGGVRQNAVEYDGDTLGRLTLERVRYGARVAKLTGLPVMVTGGSVSGGETEAKLMRDALENEYGIAVKWAEGQSRTTHENARFASAILRAAGIDRVVLVAHGFDMPRARAEFARAGIDVIPAPTGTPQAKYDAPLDYLPGIAGLQGSYYAVYEILANAVLWITSAWSAL
ncbi:MAG: YdcF family protein [Casimicrobiaceae bacterium]